MFDWTGAVVRSQAGRDKGGLFWVTGVDHQRDLLLLADGKRRKAAKPKAKKLGHVEILTQPDTPPDNPVAEKLKRGEPATDRELRRALCAFKEGYTLG